MAETGHLPTLRQLRHLVALAEHEHFGRAAESCSITQSSLSASIRELETLLGQRLVERTRRSVFVTPLGRAVVERAQGLLVGAQEIVDLVAAAAAPLSGLLRLGVIPTIGPFLLPRVLPALRRAYPGLRLYLKEDTSARLVDGLQQGALDLILLAFPYPVPGLATWIFAEDPFWLAFPQGHPLGERERVPVDALRDVPLMLLEEGHCLRDQALAACAATDTATPSEFQGSSLPTLVQMVENGLGLTLLPKMAIDAGLIRGTRLDVRPLDGGGTVRRIGFAWRKASVRAEEFGLLAGFFEDELGTPLPRRSARRHDPG